jgi:hypothetical protein
MRLLHSVIAQTRKNYQKKEPKENAMNTPKQAIESLVSKLPDDCSLEDVQYHLYVLTKVRQAEWL